MTVDRIREIVDQKFLKENGKLVTKVTHCLDFTLGNLFAVVS
jgi:hypothetical protein